MNVTTPAVAPRPDIVFLADTTGSMDPALANVGNVGNNIGTIMYTVRAAQPEARFAVGEYKEERDGPRVFRTNTPLTDDEAADQVAQALLDGVRAGGSGDDAAHLRPGVVARLLPHERRVPSGTTASFTESVTEGDAGSAAVALTVVLDRVSALRWRCRGRPSRGRPGRTTSSRPPGR